MEIRFQKMHGTMNDFVVCHDFEGAISFSADRIVSVCDRRRGVGADGIIVVRNSAVADFFMDYANADGSLAEMCGNGIRCLAKYVYDNKLTQKRVLPVETRAGVKTVEILTDPDDKVDKVRVDMGPPIFDPKSIPANLVTDGSPVLDHPIVAGGRTFAASILSMGNPHCVIRVDEEIGDLPRRYGPTIENHPLFPAKTNVEFIRVEDRTRISMRVWERGSGETFACGTGAAASAVAAGLKGLVDSPCTVGLLGGELVIEWNSQTSPVFMTGTAVSVYKGVITL